jgi:hypothetical protein
MEGTVVMGNMALGTATPHTVVIADTAATAIEAIRLLRIVQAVDIMVAVEAITALAVVGARIASVADPMVEAEGRTEAVIAKRTESI